MYQFALLGYFESQIIQACILIFLFCIFYNFLEYVGIEQ